MDSNVVHLRPAAVLPNVPPLLGMDLVESLGDVLVEKSDQAILVKCDAGFLCVQDEDGSVLFNHHGFTPQELIGLFELLKYSLLNRSV